MNMRLFADRVMPVLQRDALSPRRRRNASYPRMRTSSPRREVIRSPAEDASALTPTGCPRISPSIRVLAGT